MLLTPRSPRSSRFPRRSLRKLPRSAAAVLLGGSLLVAPAAGATLQDDADVVERLADRPAANYPEGEPPDGQWLEDDEGRRYFISKVRKGTEGRDYKRLEGQSIRFKLGWELDLVAEDKEHFYVLVPAPSEAARQFGRGREEAVVRDESESSSPDRGPGTDLAEKLREADPSTLTARMSSHNRGLPRSGQWREDFRLVDFDGDGALDIVHGPPRKGNAARPFVFLNRGEQGWERVAPTVRSEKLDYGDIEVADFDGDGRVDLALGMHLMGTTVLYGTEDGTFVERADGFDRPAFAKPNSPFGKRAPWSSRTIVSLDVDDDGDLDLLALGEGLAGLSTSNSRQRLEPTLSEGVSLYLNNGDGTWEPRRFADLPPGGTDLALAEIDGTPGPELIVAWSVSGENRIVLDLSNDAGELRVEALELFPREGQGVSVTAVAAEDLVPGGVDEVLVAELIRQEDEELSRLRLLSRADDSDWRSEVILEIPLTERITALATGDVDDDGDLDIVVGTEFERIFVLRAEAPGRYAVARSDHSSGRYGCAVRALAVGDVAGDGRAELITAFAGERTSLPGLAIVPGCPGEGRIEVFTVEGFDQVAGETEPDDD